MHQKNKNINYHTKYISLAEYHPVDCVTNYTRVTNIGQLINDVIFFVQNKTLNLCHLNKEETITMINSSFSFFTESLNFLQQSLFISKESITIEIFPQYH